LNGQAAVETNRMRFLTYAKTLSRYWRMTQDRRTPAAVRWLIYGGIAVTLIPDDWLPDWMPGLGLLDDAAIIPSVIALSLLLVPEEVKRDYDAREERELAENKAEALVQRRQEDFHPYERASFVS
jgi:uncharacterized membrane protein YkvA (DUF1232 family)